MNRIRRRCAVLVAIAAAWLPFLGEAQPQSKSAEHTLTVISGQPRARGQMYGEKFRKGIHDFLGREIYQAFTGKPATKREMLAYAAACAEFSAAAEPQSGRRRTASAAEEKTGRRRQRARQRERQWQWQWQRQRQW